MAIDTKSKLLRDAEKFVLQGKIPQAIAEYHKVVKNDPSDVLTLNTIGDLYLRLGRTSDAHRVFIQVAESYTRDNFLLKAIAVYKKVLSADRDNLDINQTLATLYARQGLNVDARNQFLRVAEICTREDKVPESLVAYEKAVEMDPANWAVQLKLADIYLGQGLKEKAQHFLAGAGRAQAKAGDHSGAAASLHRALELNPLDIETTRAFLDSSSRIAKLDPVIDSIKHALSIVPDSLDMREMLGQAQLAAGDIKGAAIAFEMTLALDEARYDHFFEVAGAFLEAEDYDSAASALDPISAKLISKRETDRAVRCYEQVLEHVPAHVPALRRLAQMYSALNDQGLYIDTLERLAGAQLDNQDAKGALESLEKIIQIAPDVDRYLPLHERAFITAYPGTPYEPPSQPAQARREAVMEAAVMERDSDRSHTTPSRFVESDLLLNYGMTDKALDMLQALAAQDPFDREVRARLMVVYRESANPRKAAEQCAMLAALERRSQNEEAAQRHIAEARKLDPELVDSRFDLAAFARQHGVELADASPGSGTPVQPRLEVDLSGDVSEIFFHDGAKPPAPEELGRPAQAEESTEEYSRDVPTPKPQSESLPDQLQEVDFYIRLGFADEARAKLDEIARARPGHPELGSRYEQLEGLSARFEGGATPAPATASSQAGVHGVAAEGPRDPCFGLGGSMDASERFSFEPSAEPGHERLSIERGPDAAAQIFSLEPEPGPVRPGSETPVRRMPDPAPAAAPAPDSHEGQVNAMFADLIDEVNALTDQEAAREDFETHFNLGTAYREMALIDDAISEFQAAIKTVNVDQNRKDAVRCCGMLSTCYLEKGMPRSAIRWCQTGLRLTEFSSHEALALRYDMGVAHGVEGDSARALECFGEIFGIDPSYRDVAQRIDVLKNGPGRNVP